MIQQEVVMLTLGHGTYEKNIQKLRKVYAELHNAGKQHERDCQDVRTKQEAEDCGLRCIDVRFAISTTSVCVCVNTRWLIDGDVYAFEQALKEIVEQNAPTLRQVAEMAKVREQPAPYVQ